MTTEMAQVLAIGASGSFGGAVTRELLGRGYPVRAMVRRGGTPVHIDGVTTVEGSALELEDLRRASEGAEIIVYGFNLPYPEWHAGAVKAAKLIAQVAAERQALVVFPGNVYGLGDDFSAPLGEDASRNARSTKGQLRNAMEACLQEATQRGARVLIVRAGDYFGPGSGDTRWLNFMLQRTHRGGAILQPTRGDAPHAWAYLPDLARTTAELVERRAELSPHEVFHFRGHEVDMVTMLDAVRSGLGDPQRKARNVPWWALRGASLFSPMLREVLEMRYLWDEPVRLDEGKLRRFLGDVPQTPLPEAVQRTLAAQRHASQAA